MENGNFDFQELADKIFKLTKNKLYFQYKSLSPAIYRMPIEYVEIGSGMFGTDSRKIYADPMAVIMIYKQSPELFLRKYLHMLFHCIYLHPFLAKEGVDTGLWNIAEDICAEAAVARLTPVILDEDDKRNNIIKNIKAKVKMFLPELVYKELTNNTGAYDIAELPVLFHMDDHIWLQKDEGQNNNGSDDENNEHFNPNKQPQSQTQNNSSDENKNDEDVKDTNGSGNGNGNNKSDDSQSSTSNQRSNSQQKKQEWSDVARRIAADMQAFNKKDAGTESGNMIQEIDYLTKDKMEYDEFLRNFAILEEKMMVNLDEFDYSYYMYGIGLDVPGADDKKILLIEPLEYKETKVVKDFVIAIDTSGSCSGELVKKFINKTYSILKETESFSSRVNIHIVQCDTRVQSDTKIENMEDMEKFLKEMKLYGFGGTDFRPVFEYVDELIAKKEFTNLCGLIYFTDGYGTYPAKPTQYKTAFAFLEDYNNRDDVPSWAMSVFWKDE